MPKLIQVPAAESAMEAAGLMFGGFLWFLFKKPIVTVLTLAFLLSGPAYIAWDWATSYRVQVKKARPASSADDEVGSIFSTSSVAYAGVASRPCKDSIKVHGIFYGCKDTTLTAYAILGTDRWIIHDHETEDVYDVEFPYFREQKKAYEQKKK